MGVLASLVALALVGADGGATPKPEPMLTYQVRVLEMDDIGWREMLYYRLKPVGRQGMSTVWTTSRPTAKALQSQAGRVVCAPKVTSDPEATATICVGPSERRYVAGMRRKANGPLHHASTIAYEPESDVIRESLRTTLTGREAESGFRLAVACDATWVAAMHKVKMPEMFLDGEGLEAGMITSSLEVPEVATAKIDGEWLVPKDEVLVVSLGVRASVDREQLEKGDDAADDAVQIRERLLVVEVAAVTGAVTPTASALPPPPVPIGRATMRPDGLVKADLTVTLPPVAGPSPTAPLPPVPIAALPMPEPPSRSLPLPLAGGGSLAEPLPPLPDEAAVPASLSQSSEPRPSPQSAQVATSPSTTPTAAEASVEDLHGVRFDAPPMVADRVKAWVKAEVDRAVKPTDGDVEVACPGQVVGVKTRCDEPAREAWNLTLVEAIRTAIDNSDEIDVVSATTPHIQPIVIAPVEGDASMCRFRASVMEVVRSVEQQYWALYIQQVEVRTREAAVRLGTEVLKREIDALGAGRGTTADVAEARQMLENYQLQLLTATADSITCERQLRNILGLPPADHRRIVPVTAPSEARVDADWDSSLKLMVSHQPDIVRNQANVDLAEVQLFLARNPNLLLAKLFGTPSDGSGSRQTMANVRQAQYQCLRQRGFLQQVMHRTTHSLARFFLEVEANYKQFQTATQCRSAAEVRLATQREGYEAGRLTLDRYLEAINTWAEAVAQEARFKATYNVAIVAMEEAKGTLLEHENIKVAEKPATTATTATAWRRIAVAPLDPSMVRAVHPEEAKGETCCDDKCTSDGAAAKSGTLRIPLGGKIAVEIRATVAPAPKP